MSPQKKRSRIDPDTTLEQYLGEREAARERAARVRFEEIGTTEFTDETLRIVLDILGWLTGKPVEAEITDYGADPIRWMHWQGSIFRIEESPGGGFILWIGDQWLPIAAETTFRRGSIGYRLESQEWWGWCFLWTDPDTGWEIELRDRSRCPKGVGVRGLCLFDAATYSYDGPRRSRRP